MAGFPFFQLDRFLKILVQDLNKHVAISEEFANSPSDKVKTGGLMFDRRVARVVTPGTLIDEKFIDPSENNFLLSISYGTTAASTSHTGSDAAHFVVDDEEEEEPGDGEEQKPRASRLGLAWLDLSTGQFLTQTTTLALLPSVLARICPREVVLQPHEESEGMFQLEEIINHGPVSISIHRSREERSLTTWNHAFEAPMEPDAEAMLSKEETKAIDLLLDYVEDQLQGLELKLQPPRRKLPQETMTIDRNSMRGLEILETARDGFGKGSLLHAVRRTCTKGGSRLLRERLSNPSTSLTEINARLDIVASFLADQALLEQIKDLLRRSHDAQRLVQKISLNKGDPDDLICLARTIEASKAVGEILERVLENGGDLSTADRLGALRLLRQRLDLHGPVELGRQITDAIDEDGLNQAHRSEENEAAIVAAQAQDVILNEALPEELESMPEKLRKKNRAPDTKDAGMDEEDTWIMKKTASKALGKLHVALDQLFQEKTRLTQQLRDELQAPTLILKWTPGLGHICHVRGARKVPLESLGARVVSSTKSTQSFYLSSWSRLGGQIDQAKLNIRQEEQRIFANIRSCVIQNLVKIRRNAAVLDELDVACSFAALAGQQGLNRPKLNDGTRHQIIGGRHPTVKLGLEEQGRPFVSNDLSLDEQERIWLVTGPNMAGKSTFLRQNALISILAQTGSYVPADYAEIGLVDQIFSRIGAADDLFRDQSTFMVEMLETATILRQATPQSFVIMDEVGRGTTPEDGVAVAYACLHHIHYVNRCRTLFATHFHALADMTAEFSHLGRYCTDVAEDERGSFTYLHRLRTGVNRRSHALKVARLAGIPDSAIEIAQRVLEDPCPPIQ